MQRNKFKKQYNSYISSSDYPINNERNNTQMGIYITSLIYSIYDIQRYNGDICVRYDSRDFRKLVQMHVNIILSLDLFVFSLIHGLRHFDEGNSHG